MYSGIARRWAGREGYSLVEVSLALLIAGLGILAAFGLFPQGLDSSRRSVEATEMATFAGFVFENLQSDVWAYSTNDTMWNNMLSDKSTGDPWELNMVHAFEYGGGGAQNYVLHTGPDRANAELYAWKPAYYGQTEGAALQSYEVARFTYTLDLEDVPAPRNLLTARLEVWPGDRVGKMGTSTGTVFYREYRRP
jgi:hypothetical protein